MSFYVIDWATSVAPTANIYESHILTVMAGRADRDGCGVFLSASKLAASCHCDRKTVQKHLDEMERRGLIGPGDQTSPGAQKWRNISADRRPNFYDILVPFEWYSAQQMAEINEDRAGLGRALLTPENRPPIAAAPPKPRRSDLGKKRPERRKKTDADAPAETPSAETPSPAETSTGGISVPPCDDPETPSETESRGEYQSPKSVKRTCHWNLSAGGTMRRPPRTPQRT